EGGEEGRRIRMLARQAIELQVLGRQQRKPRRSGRVALHRRAPGQAWRAATGQHEHRVATLSAGEEGVESRIPAAADDHGGNAVELPEPGRQPVQSCRRRAGLGPVAHATCGARNCWKTDFGMAPRVWSTIWPFLNSTKVGMLEMRNCAASS